MKDYATELKKFFSGQNIYTGVRISLAVLVPSLIFSYFGVFKMFFLFPLGTSFIAFVDQPGPFIRRRNTLIGAIVSFFMVATIASLLKDYPLLVLVELVVMGLFFNMIGVFGQRLAAVGGLSLVVLAIFIDGHLTGEHIFYNILIFTAGAAWYLLLFSVLAQLQPYKLAKQMVGENYIELGKYLEIKAKFYGKNPDYEQLLSQLLAQQVLIKNTQEETRDLVFRTRKFVNESTTTSRLLMLSFISSIDLYEKLLTSETDYQKLQQRFSGTRILGQIQQTLQLLASELSHIGVSTQAGQQPKPKQNINAVMEDCFNAYFDLRMQRLSPDTLDDFMILRQVMMRMAEVAEDIKAIYQITTQDINLAKSLSSGLDLSKFLPKEEPLNFKVFKTNFSRKSAHFRHAIRVTTAMLIGYTISKMTFHGLGHSYWVLITIIAIMRPAYSITKSRNLLRLYGTAVGAVVGALIIYFVHEPTLLLILLFISMALCFTMLRTQYFWAVLFMTVYVFIAFNFLNPGHFETLLKDRIFDTLIAGIVAFGVSYFVMPVWEHTQNRTLMKVSQKNNRLYFEEVLAIFQQKAHGDEHYRLLRKNAIIALANLSDNFQRMLSDPKTQQKKLEDIHQFVTTSHLLTAYIASLSQYAQSGKTYSEIDFASWYTKIDAEMHKTQMLLNNTRYDASLNEKSEIRPEDYVSTLLQKRKMELAESEVYNIRNPKRITHLTELKNIQELLDLIYNVAKEQRKVAVHLKQDYTAVTTAKI
ncbi:FUSC family protein [Riemerella columbina]|uniref:FUSC family protein n=1 Tax=Riemerella columbina TaxID=103810 RepID=UPI00267015A2|nr:FUSC family membrane protein [Riemerella columbina]WKS94313.1 FUSC family protein [Riemerella columbina]